LTNNTVSNGIVKTGVLMRCSYNNPSSSVYVTNMFSNSCMGGYSNPPQGAIQHDGNFVGECISRSPMLSTRFACMASSAVEVNYNTSNCHGGFVWM